MKNRYLVSFITALLFVSLITVVQADDRTQEKAAQHAAETWMPLFDSGKYAESWEELAQYTKAHLDKRTWEVYLIAVRQPLGELKTRKLKRAQFIKSLKGVPDQSGAILEYESSFENKKSVIETFAMMLEKDGTWRVANYIPKDGPRE
ncbi:MAG TPA: DUF4019 domain-containing protein [Pyrinomonadaceae bacterium]|jgi:hypothetical protein|nr:DUF4019 domain-containing protein [Pyrinomonadaceae bacterium]